MTCDPCRNMNHGQCAGPQCYCWARAHKMLLPVLKRGYKKKLPDRTVNIMRPGVYGNPFVIGRDGTRDEVVRLYRVYLWSRPKTDPEFKEKVESLRTSADALLCCCDPMPCHGHVMSEYLATGGA